MFQKRCYAALGCLSHGQRLRLANDAGDRFQLLPRQRGAPVFNFEPEPLVTVAGGELKTVAALTAFLADLYMAGRITAEGAWRCSDRGCLGWDCLGKMSFKLYF